MKVIKIHELQLSNSGSSIVCLGERNKVVCSGYQKMWFIFFNKYFFNTNYVPDSLLGSEDKGGKNTVKIPVFL